MPGLRRRFGSAIFSVVSLVIGAGCVAAERTPQTHTVEIRGFQYAPATLAVKVGDLVLWKNADLVPHTASAKGTDLETGSLGVNGTGRYTARRKGTFAYVCAFHPTMKGTLVVR